MLNLSTEIDRIIKAKQLFTKKDKLLLAFSGGIDSAVLAYALNEGGYNVTLAHCNFQLRGVESDEDENYVKCNYCQTFPLRTIRFDTKKEMEASGKSAQEVARKLRYDWFEKLMQKEGYDFLLTAHHADDNVETVLMNFAKGTGIKGLRGIKLKQGKIVRPMLFATKDEIETFAIAKEIGWREDSSNSSTNYTRNHFRKIVVPALEAAFPQASKNITKNIERFADIEKVYEVGLAHLLNKMVVKGDGLVKVPILKLQKAPARKTLIHEIYSEYGFGPHQVDEIEKLLKAETGSRIFSATHQLLVNRNWLLLTQKSAATQTVFVMDKEDGAIDFPLGTISKKHLEKVHKIETDQNIALLDAKNISFPLIIRKWQLGDYFYPLGMQKKKKLSKFFIDNKLSLIEKENTWVVESNKKILWIVGQRIDDRFKINLNGSKCIVRLRLTPFSQKD